MNRASWRSLISVTLSNPKTQLFYLNIEQLAAGTQSWEYTVQTLSVKHNIMLAK